MFLVLQILQKSWTAKLTALKFCKISGLQNVMLQIFQNYSPKFSALKFFSISGLLISALKFYIIGGLLNLGELNLFSS